MSSNDNDPDEFEKPSVQDIIDRLNNVEDKSQPFEILMECDDGFYADYSAITLREYTNMDLTPNNVGLEVILSGEITQSFRKNDEEDNIEYYGKQVTLSPYEDCHKPQNQKQIQGIPFNPTLRDSFNETPNDERDASEIEDWWDLPYIQSCTWSDNCESYSSYLERVSGIEGHTPMTLDEFNKDQEEKRIKWFEAWPSGTRYNVRCLDGGAWDRSTSWAMVSNIDEAIAIAQTNNTKH